MDHERSYVETLRSDGLRLVDLSGHFEESAVKQTIDAMKTGADIIIQPVLRDGRWFGRPDILRR